MDGARLVSVNILRNRAYTSATLDMPMYELTEMSESGNSLYGLDMRDDGRMVIFDDSYPPERDGKVIGATSVSDGVVAQDRDVAETGVECRTKLVGMNMALSDDWAVPKERERLMTNREDDRTRRSTTSAARS